ncbi:hypothetical protein K8T06_07930, partial [bacterium]|nr:hypothetical protein [bacterium]
PKPQIKHPAPTRQIKKPAPKKQIKKPAPVRKTGKPAKQNKKQTKTIDDDDEKTLKGNHSLKKK